MVNHINNVNGPQSSTARNSGSVDNNANSNSEANSRASAEALVDNKHDTVQLSARAQELSRIQRDLQALPEVDEARVNDIRERIASHYLQLMPPLSYISRYDLIFGTDNCVTALRRHVAHRSYFTVTNGTVGAKLIHPEHLTDVSFGCTPEMTSDMWSSVAKLDTSISTVKDVSLHRGQTLFVPPYWGVIFHMTKDSFMLSVKYSTYMTEMATCLHTFRFWYHKMTTRPTVVPDVHVATDPSSSSADIIPDGVNDMNEIPVSDNICINNEDEPEDK